jgi:class 3 adenylate cyclase
LDGERKVVTMLFADIKGSMDLIEDLDPEEARAIVDPALKLMMDAVDHYGGYVAQSTGDGIFALFGAPIAHEDHPHRALLAALRMQQELRRYSARTRAEGHLPIQVRVGINTGEVVVRAIQTGEGRTEYAPVGHSTGIAARMQTLAPIGSIATTEQVRKLCEGYFAFAALGPTKVKGVSEPVNVYEVTGLGPLRTRLQRSATRGYTKFVGREREMEALKHAAELAKGGRGQIVTVVADPGVGKSRLFFEFKATSRSGCLVLEGLSFSHGKTTAYLPLVELIQSYFGIDPDDEPYRRREKVAGKVAMLDLSLEETLPYLFGLLGILDGVDPLAGMDEQIRRRRTQDAVKRVLMRESLKHPLMIIFEDLHWIDDETQGFLNLLAEVVANAPVLLLVNYRPEYTHNWNSKTYYTQLRLDPLGIESAGEILTARLGDSPQLAQLKRLILERTQGNPLFIEELVEALFDEGVLVRNGAVKVTRALNQLNTPPTVEGILAARIDRLPPEAKDLLQTLSVVGSEFQLALVRQVAQFPANRLDQLLDVLQAGEFIYEQPSTADVEYSFKHALTHDEAYKSLLTERRKTLHERTARAIEALYSQRLEDHYASLAYHYRSSDNAPKAVEYLLLAGEQAVDRGAYAQSGGNAELALNLIERLPEGVERLRAELRVRLLQGKILPVLYGVASPERLQGFERVCELSEQVQDPSALFLGLYNVAYVYVLRGEVQRARELMRRCVEIAEQLNDSKMITAAQYILAMGAYHSGNLPEASSRFSDLMKRLVSAQSGVTQSTPGNLWVLTPGTFAYVQHVIGRSDEALKLSEEALRRGRQLKEVFSLGIAISIAGTLRYFRREAGAAREVAQTETALAEEHGFRDRLVSAQALRGWAMSELGQTEQGIAELESVAASGPSVSQMRASVMLPQAYARVSRSDRALAILDADLAKFEKSGTRLFEAECYRLKGEAILIRDSSATTEAEACFRKAIEVAKAQSAKSWELRATVNLARLLRDTGRREEARAMLTEIYNWFTEGFDTADLKDAKALLDELSA